MDDAQPRLPHIPRALIWLAAIMAAYTVVHLLDPPPPGASDHGGDSDESGAALGPLPANVSTADISSDVLGIPLAKSFEDVEWFWAFVNRRELCLNTCDWTTRTRVALAELRSRLSLESNTVMIFRPDRGDPGSRFAIVPYDAAFLSHPLCFMIWLPDHLVGSPAQSEPAVFSASPLPSAASEALSVLLHALGNEPDITKGRSEFFPQFLQLDAWMREFEAAGSDSFYLPRCSLNSWNTSGAPHPSEGYQSPSTRRVDWLLHAALRVVVDALEGGDAGGVGLFAESMWDEVLRESFNGAFLAAPPEARPTAAAGLAGNLALLESVAVVVLNTSAADLLAGPHVWPPAWPVQMRALRVLVDAETDPENGWLSDKLLDTLGVASSGDGVIGSVRGQLRRFLVRAVADALMPTEYFLPSLRAALVAMRTAAHMLRKGARLRDVVAVPSVSFESSCCCSYLEAIDPLRDLELVLLGAEALDDLVYSRGEGYDGVGRNLSALAAQAHKDRLDVLRRDSNCRFEASRNVESLEDAVHRRRACLSGEGRSGVPTGDAGSGMGAFPSFPVPAGMPEKRGTGIVWLNVIGASLVAANRTPVVDTV